MLQNEFAAQTKRLDQLQPCNKECTDRDPAQLKQRKNKSKSYIIEEKERQHKTRSRNRNNSDSRETVLDSSKDKKSRKGLDNLNIPFNCRLARDIFSEDSSNSSGSSGCDQHDMGRSSGRRKIRSGARVKKRPVVRTELWPHTIANEKNGDEVDSENIGLATFFSCFTFILMSYGKAAESKGRAALLHALSMVFVYLP